MTHIEIPLAGQSRWRAMGRWSVNFLSWITRYAKARRAAAELHALDDRMLTDIGITRGEINHIVWCGSDRPGR